MSTNIKKPTKNELLILHELRKNSRNSLALISRKIDIPASTIFDKVNTMQKEIIQKYVTLLNFHELGYSVKVHYIIKAEHKKELQEYLQQHKNINTIYKTNNETDFLVEAIFKEIKEAQEFIESLQVFGIERVQQFFIAEDIMREAFLTKKQHIDLISIPD